MTNTTYKLQSRLMGRHVTIEKSGYSYTTLLPDVICRDGFIVSVQASAFHYCTPRSNFGPWQEVELGYPSEPMPELAEYCDAYDEDKSTATNTVWGRVPLEKIAKIIDDHGGLVPEVNQ